MGMFACGASSRKRGDGDGAKWQGFELRGRLARDDWRLPAYERLPTNPTWTTVGKNYSNGTTDNDEEQFRGSSQRPKWMLRHFSPPVNHM